MQGNVSSRSCFGCSRTISYFHRLYYGEVNGKSVSFHDNCYKSFHLGAALGVDGKVNSKTLSDKEVKHGSS